MTTPLLLIPGEAIAVATRGPDVISSTHASGAPAIAAWVAAGLGVRTAFAGGVGADAAGQLITATLDRAGTDLSALITVADRPTATATVEYFPDGSRSFEFTVRDTAATALTTAHLGDLPERCTWIHVSGSALMFGNPLADATVAAVDRARAGGATVSVDPNLRAELTDPHDRAVLREMCRVADVLFPSDDELARLGLDEAELVGRGAVVCNTLGALGARLRSREGEVTLPAVTAADRVVDPDGAGDTFAAAVVAARLRDLSWTAALHAATQVTGRAVTVAGPMAVPLDARDLDRGAET